MFTPSNILDVAGKELETKHGGSIRASIRPVGGGWDVMTIQPPSPEDKSDFGMLPQRYISENIDVWTACRLLNEAVKR